MTSTAKIVVVTGAGSGLGRAMSCALSEGGHRVVLVGRRPEALAETADACPAETVVEPLDVTDGEAVAGLFARVAGRFGRLDALVNNAGTWRGGGTIDEVRDEDWAGALAVNVTAYFACAREAWRIMRDQDPQGGRIINNGSIAAHVPRVGGVTYSTTKHAVTGLTRSLELDGRAVGIRCSQIDIGNAETAMTEPMRDGIPQPDGSVRSEPVFDPAHVGDLVRRLVELPLDVTMPYVTIAAAGMPWIGRG